MITDTDRSSIEATYPVRFTADSLSSPDNSHDLYGRGELQLAEGWVEFRGTARRAFRFGRHKVVRIPRADIMNVECSDNRIRFEMVGPGATAQHIAFWAADETEAAAIAARLPGTQSEKFRTVRAEAGEFASRLLAVSPVAFVTPILIGINGLVFLVMAFNGAGILSPDPEVHIRWGSNFGPQTIAGEWWRLGSSMFLHFGALHLALNMWVLYSFGAMAERLFGWRHFFVLYALAGLTGSLASLWWNPEVNSAGASGAIFGVFGGLLAFVLRKKNRVPASIMVAHRNALLSFVTFNLVFGFLHPAIDNAAHLGGLVSGFLLGLALARPLDVELRAETDGARLTIVAVAGSALLAIAAHGIARGNAVVLEDQEFRRSLQWFDAREADAVKRYDALARQFRANELTTKEFIDGMERDAIPFWDEAAERFAGKPISTDSRIGELRRLQRDYVVSRCAMLRALVAGYREEGKQFEQATLEFRKSEAMLERLRELRTAD